MLGALFGRARENHGLDDREAVRLEKHVLGAAQTEAFRAEPARAFRIARIVGVRPHAEAPEAVGPRQKLDELGIGYIRDHGRELT